MLWHILIGPDDLSKPLVVISLLPSVHPETPTLREARQLGDTDEKRNLLIHKPYDFAALCGPAVITAKKLRLWTGTT